VERTPELAKAVKRTLELRGNRTTGWAIAWRIALQSRLLEGEDAYTTYRKLLTYTRRLNTKAKTSGTIGGTYPNMLDAHPPFQIDANFGAPVGVVEMLLQSQFGSIDLLPALPKSWSEGSFRGLRARGAFEVDLKWQSGAVKSGSILSIAGGECTLRSRTPLKIKGAKATTKKVGEWYLIKFATIVGGRYHIERA
jgi:alpha-L-fucosidase 2